MTRQHNQGGEEAQRLLDEARASANVEGKIADLEAAHKAKLDAIETRVVRLCENQKIQKISFDR